MKHAEARPYADPEAAARKLIELAAGVQPINDRVHIEKINGPFLSKTGCNASGPEFGAGIRLRSREAGSSCTKAAPMCGCYPPSDGLLDK